MAKQAHTPLVALGTMTSKYVANAADLVMTAADTVNKEEVQFTGAEIVVAHNTGAGSHNITISSVADSMGRTGDIATYALGAGEYAIFGPFGIEGWLQATGKLYFEADHAEVKFGVVKLPL